MIDDHHNPKAQVIITRQELLRGGQRPVNFWAGRPGLDYSQQSFGHLLVLAWDLTDHRRKIRLDALFRQASHAPYFFFAHGFADSSGTVIHSYVDWLRRGSYVFVDVRRPPDIYLKKGGCESFKLQLVI